MSEPQALLNKNFVLLWSGQAVSVIGTKAFNIAVMYWIKEVTGSATMMGMALMLTNLPGIFLGPIGGAAADQFSRRAILIISDLIDGLAILLLACLFYLRPEDNQLLMNAILTVSVLTGITGSFFGPAISAALPDLVPKKELAKANALKQFAGQFSAIIGQVAGPAVFRIFGPFILFFVNGVSFLLSAGAESFIRIPQKIPEKADNFRQFYVRFIQNTKEGFRYVWRNKGIRTVFLGIATVNLFLGPTTVLLPFYVDDMLGKSMDWYGYLMGAMGLGFVVGGLIISMTRIATVKPMMLALLPLFALTYCGLGFHLPAAASLALFLVFGVLVSLFNVHITTQIQKKTDSAILGRVFGLLNTLSRSLYPISLGLSGIVADLFDREVLRIYLGCGVILLLITLALVLNRRYRDFLTPVADG